MLNSVVKGSPVSHAELGYALRGCGDRVGALAAFEAAVAGDPSRAELKVQVAIELRELGRVDEAEQILRALLDQEPDDFDFCMELGHVLRRRGDRAGALASFQAAAAADPGHIGVKLEAAVELRKLDRLEETESIFRTVLDRHANHVPALIGLGRVLRRRGDHTGALAAFEAAARVDPALPDIAEEIAIEQRALDRAAVAHHMPTDFAAHVERGYAERQRGDHAAALAAWEAAAAAEPAEMGVRIEAAAELRDLGRVEDSERALRHVLAEAPSNLAAITCLCQILRERGDRAGALAAFEGAAGADPTNSDLQVQVAIELRELGRVDEAITTLNRVLDRQPDDFVAQMELGHVLRRGGHRAAALAAFRAAAEANPAHTGLEIEIASELRALDRLDDAEAVLRAILDVEPRNLSALGALGDLLRHRGDRISALACFKAAAALAPSETTMQSEMAAELGALGRLDEAEAILRGLFQEAPNDLSVLNGLCEVLRRRGDLAGALAVCEDAAAAEPNRTDLAIEVAHRLRDLGRFGEAEDSLHGILALTPDSFPALNGLGHVLRARGDHAGALNVFEAAAAIKPDDIGLEIEIANEFRELGLGHQAEQILRRILDTDPANPAALNGLGHLLRRRGDHESALTAFEAAAAAAPTADSLRAEVAHELRELGRLDDAEAVLRTVLNRDPSCAPALNALAHVLRRRGRTAAALATFEHAAAANPGDTGIRVEIALELLQLGRTDESESMLRGILDREPQSVAALTALGHVLRHRGDHAAALAAFSAAAALKPGRSELKVEAAQALRELGRSEEAETQLRKMLQDDPTNVAALIGLGHLLRQNGDRTAALVTFEAAENANPKNAVAVLEVANGLRDLGRIADAEAKLDGMLAREPDHIGALLAMGFLKLDRFRPDDAERLFERARDLSPDHGSVLVALGHLARLREDRVKALSCFEAARARDPHPIGVNLETATELRELGRFDDARRILDDLLERSPDHVDAHLQSGYLHRKQCDHTGAIASFETAAKLRPRDPQPLVELAVEHRTLGHPAPSLQYLLRAIDLDPNHLGALDQLAEHFWLAEDFERSRAFSLRAIATHPNRAICHIRASRAAAELGRYDDAFAALDQAAETIGPHPEIKAARITLHRERRDWQAAYALFLNDLDDTRTYSCLWMQLAHLAITIGDHDLALSVMPTAPPTLLEASRVHLFRGQIAEARWRLEDAADDYEKARRLTPNDAWPEGELARVTLKLLRLDDCRRHLQRQIDLNATPILLKGQTLRVSQTHIGQLIDEFVLDPERLAELQEIRRLPLDQQIEPLRKLVILGPDHTPFAIMLLIALRQAGLLVRSTEPGAARLCPPIERRIVQYWDSPEPPAEVAELMESWKQRNPDYAYERFDHRSAQGFIDEHHPNEVSQAYRRARLPAQKADIFRLAYLAVHGGFYADADDRCLAPIDTFIPATAGFVAYQEDFGTLGNNFLGAAPDHPIMRRALEQVTEAVNRGDGDFLWLASGPGLLTRAFAQLVAEQRQASWFDAFILDFADIQKSLGMHCPVRYKRTRRHWSRSLFADRTAKSS